MQSGCYDNYYGSIQLPYAPEPNTENNYDPIVLTQQVGEIKVENHSIYSCDIYVDGTKVDSNVASGTPSTLSEIKVGNHIVDVVDNIGTETFNVSVSCGVTPTVVFPQ